MWLFDLKYTISKRRDCICYLNLSCYNWIKEKNIKNKFNLFLNRLNIHISFFVLVLTFLCSKSTFSQERKIEKNVYPNLVEGKLDIALFEIDKMHEKYGEKSFFYYWKSYVYAQKIAQLKKEDYQLINIDSARIFLDNSINYLDKALSNLSIEDLNINKEDFKILFPGCLVFLSDGETKYLNRLNEIKNDFINQKINLKELQYNILLPSQIEEYKTNNKNIDGFLIEIKPRVKISPVLNALFGQVSSTTYLELASVRNKRRLIELQNENSEHNWLNYLKTYTDEEYLSIVPEIEKLVNNYYFKNLNIRYQKISNNLFALKSFIDLLQDKKKLLDSDPLKYINFKYGDIHFSNSFIESRRINYLKIINEVNILLTQNIARQKKCEMEFTYSELIKDDFNTNVNSWFEVDDQNARNKITDGKFIFECKNTSGYINLAAYKTAKDVEDFIFSINTTWLNGIDNNSYEIIWGANGFSNYYSFGISANGSYRYTHCENGKFNPIIPWTTSDYINRNGSNILTVRKNLFVIEFYINHFKVNEIEFSEFHGTQLGLFVNGIQSVVFNDLYIGYNIAAIEEDNTQASSDVQEEVFQSEEEKDPYSMKYKFVDESGDLKLANPFYISSWCFGYKNSKNYTKYRFIKGNQLCGLYHVLDLNHKAIKDVSPCAPPKCEYIGGKNENIFILSSQQSNGSQRVKDLPQKKDIGKVLYLEIQKRFILYRKKQHLIPCPICLPPTEYEYRLFSLDGVEN